MAKDQAPATQTNSNPLDQLGAIQSIIIGPAMAEMNNRLAEIEAKLASNQEETAQEIKQLRDTMTEMLTEAVSKLEGQMEAQNKQHQEQFIQLNHNKVDRKILGSLLKELGDKISGTEE